MQITSGNVRSQSQHQFEHSEQRTSLRSQSIETPALTSADRPAAAPSSAPVAAAAPEFDPDDPAALYGTNLSLLKALVEALVGKQIDLLGVSGRAVSQSGGASATQPQAAAQPAPRQAPIAGAIAAEAVHVQEAEITEVAFSGQFDTADGQSINLDLKYRLERSYSATTFSVATASAMRDPLVLNFNGQGVQLIDQQTRFDLDSDGQAETIPTLGAGSAYLALDRDGNGAIDNGRELFGPATNNGYAELAKWDNDGNGFIDAADPVFDKLRLFRPGAATQTLAERDVGAIFLGYEASPARLTDHRNRSLGQLRATGFYLTNSGGAGLVQELDLSA